jgi:glyoxylase I family protein
VVRTRASSSALCATAASFRIAALSRVGLHHLDLVVSSLERSLPLYRELLAPLGYTHVAEIAGERGEPVFYLDGEGVGASLSLREAQSPSGPHDRYAVGLHHLAFEASSRELVDDRLAWAKEKGLEIENEPQEWPYITGYYAGFFHDPDGIKLEVVHVP